MNRALAYASLVVLAVPVAACGGTVVTEEGYFSDATSVSPAAAPAECLDAVAAAKSHASDCTVHAPLGAPDATTCNQADACVAACVTSASCEALNDLDPKGFTAYLGCVHGCVASFGNGQVGGSSNQGGSSGNCDCSGSGDGDH